MILEIRKKINDEMKTVSIIGGIFSFVFDEGKKRLFIHNMNPNNTINLPCKNIEYSVHGNIVFAETE
jgi:hypothetical protein